MKEKHVRVRICNDCWAFVEEVDLDMHKDHQFFLHTYLDNDAKLLDLMVTTHHAHVVLIDEAKTIWVEQISKVLLDSSNHLKKVKLTSEENIWANKDVQHMRGAPKKDKEPPLASVTNVFGSNTSQEVRKVFLIQHINR